MFSFSLLLSIYRWLFTLSFFLSSSTNASFISFKDTHRYPPDHSDRRKRIGERERDADATLFWSRQRASKQHPLWPLLFHCLPQLEGNCLFALNLQVLGLNYQKDWSIHQCSCSIFVWIIHTMLVILSFLYYAYILCYTMYAYIQEADILKRDSLWPYSPSCVLSFKRTNVIRINGPRQFLWH